MEDKEVKQPETEKAPVKSAGKSQNTGMAVLCYIGILVLIPLLTEAKNDPFVKFHIKQGLVLLIVDVIASFVFWMPVVGQLIWLALAVIWVIGIVNAVNGKQTPLPVIGKFADNIKL